MKMHFLCSELFKIRPKFELVANETTGQVHISGRVEHHAILPPPLNSVAETFMAERSRQELANYASIVMQNEWPTSV
jgi:hypothetical protein